MIVDDEERSRTGIRSLIDWEVHNVQIIAEAQDGIEALELLKNVHVDILLTDIRMPEMDGLTLISQVKEKFPHIKSIIMSGYNDFSFAKKALSLGASDYLLKPSRKQEITDTIVNITKEIQKERNHNDHLSRLTRGFRESLPLLKEKTLSKLVFQDDISYEKLEGSLSLNGIHFLHPYFVAFIIHIDHLQTLYKDFTPFDIELLKYGLKNISEQSLHEPCYSVSFEHQDDIICVINCPTPLSYEDLHLIARKLATNAKEFLKLSISVGFGTVEQQIDNIKLSYLTAVNALDNNYYQGPSTIVGYKDSLTSEDLNYPFLKEKAVTHAIAHRDKAAIIEEITQFRRAITPANKEDIFKHSLVLLFTMYRFGIEKNIPIDELYGFEIQHLLDHMSQYSLEEIQQELIRTALVLHEQMNEKKQKNALFESILAYIEKNSAKDINRETVASEVFITPGYLSQLFKQHMKSSFLDYLHKIRIDNACELLKDKSKKIGDIALRVGYNDEKYFFQVFKKYVGMTPNQFRNNIPDEKFG